MAKEVLFGKEAMDKIMPGFDKLALSIVGTLGPKGRNVLLDDPMMPRVVNDGATIAKETVFDDPWEKLGAWPVRNTSSQTNDDAGDGTTTTAVLLHALVHESLKSPLSPVEVGNSLLEASKKVLAEIKKAARPIKDESDIDKVALISAEHEELAKVISSIVKKQGKEVLFMVEDNREGDGITVETVEGYEAHVGFVSPVYITDRKRSRAVHEKIAVLVSEKKISNIGEITPIFDALALEKINNLVIVAPEFDEGMLSVFAATHAMRKMSLLVIKATGPLLEDIAGSVGATTISESTGVAFHTFNVGKHLGFAKKVVSGTDKTLFIPLKKERALDYANILESRMNVEMNGFRRQKLRERVAKLRSGVAVVKIAAATDTEREYLKLKADDASHAVVCALEEGVVEGGGMCLWRIAAAMKPKTVGEQILKKALTAPLKTICANGDKDYTEVVSQMPAGQGYDAKNDEYVDMWKAGIIDPAKVERIALENSVSTAAKFITSFAVIAEIPPKTS